MKFVKKITALFLAICMVMAMGITAFAAEKTYSITVNGDSGHKYQAYQLFAGDLSEDETTLSNVKWGTGVNGEALLSALKADETIGSDFTNCTTAANVAEVLATKKADGSENNKYADKSEALIAFSKIVGANLSTTATGTSAETKLKDDSNNETGKSSYKISGLAAGYYIVQDESNTAPSDDAYTRYILQVVKNVEVTAKVDVPSIDKTVKTGKDESGNATYDKANTASIGDKVEFKVISKVPDMTGYDKYYFILNDTMSKGLTFNDDVEISINGQKLTNTDDKKYYTVTNKKVTKDENGQQVSTGETAIKIVFNDFIQHKDLAGKDIVVTYSATLNQDADLTTAGNPNEVKLTYSNNPNITDNGQPDNPDEPSTNGSKVTGETPKSETKTYVTGIKLIKVDAQNVDTKLKGAKFQISGEKLDVVLVNKTIYEKDANGTYYMLKDGTYTITAPTEDSTDSDGNVTKGTADQYDSTTNKYKKVTVVDKDTQRTNFQAVGYTGKDGILTFEGLGAGTYTIEELVAPDGYNLLGKDITVTITAGATLDAPNWTIKAKLGSDTESTLTAGSDNLYSYTIQNNKGSILPSTGGMGTTVIYIAGIAMIVAAGIVVIVRKRMA